MEQSGTKRKYFHKRLFIRTFSAVHHVDEIVLAIRPDGHYSLCCQRNQTQDVVDFGRGVEPSRIP